MSLIRLNPKLIKPFGVQRLFSTLVQNDDEEYTPTPQYPPILDLSYEKRLERKKEAAYEEIKNVKTVEEKQIKLNMPKYYGFKCYLFKEDHVPYNNLALAQHITKTHLIESKTLPEYYNEINVDQISDYIKPIIEEAVLNEYEGYKRKHELNDEELTKSELENIIATSISKQLNRVIMNNLSQDFNHLLDTQVDFEPRIESFWFAGGMDPPENIKRYRRAKDWTKPRENEPTNRAIQYFGQPILTLRNELPLNPIVPHIEASNPEFKVPFFKYDPRTVGITTNHQHAANIPGYWPGDVYQFGILSYHKRGHILDRHYNDPEDDKDTLHKQAILASFGWLNAQANFLGFTTYNEITYPLVAQTIITNGQTWSFYTYQLNTLLNHGKYATENPRSNICWALPELKLFESIKDGKLVGLNDDVLKTLLKYYANVPQKRLGVNLMPYLSQQEQVIADYVDEDKRQWLEREYKYLVSNRPRYKLDYEVYHWEKIYKIDNETRPLEARRRPFELRINPWNRKLNERQAFYIPRKLRPELPRYKGRWAKEYFP